MAQEKRNRYRKYLVTINNPIEKGFNHEAIKSLCNDMGALYFCMADEEGNETETFHTHVYMRFKNAVEWESIRKAFHESSHIDACKGTEQQNRDYIKKGGKWEDSEKSETRVEGSYEEYGEFKEESQGKRNDWSNAQRMVEDGCSNREIIDEYPHFIEKVNYLDKYRLMLKEEQYKYENRDIKVFYIWGDTGVGKTRYVYDTWQAINIFKVTNYDQHPFDGYEGQDILLLDEFRESFPLQYMLNLTDRYPLRLPRRYEDAQACFTKVYIVSNWSLESQYTYETNQRDLEAFRRRILQSGGYFRMNNVGNLVSDSLQDKW